MLDMSYSNVLRKYLNVHLSNRLINHKFHGGIDKLSNKIGMIAARLYDVYILTIYHFFAFFDYSYASI